MEYPDTSFMFAATQHDDENLNLFIMTDDYRGDGLDYVGVNPPRSYHFYKVRFYIHNTYTDEHKKVNFYVSAKRSLTWMQSIIPGRFNYPLAGEPFAYTFIVEEVEDDDNILFHHVTTKADWERTSLEYFLVACASVRWNITWKLKIKKFFRRLIDRKPKRVEVGYSV